MLRGGVGAHHVQEKRGVGAICEEHAVLPAPGKRVAPVAPGRDPGARVLDVPDDQRLIIASEFKAEPRHPRHAQQPVGVHVAPQRAGERHLAGQGARHEDGRRDDHSLSRERRAAAEEILAQVLARIGRAPGPCHGAGLAPSDEAAGHDRPGSACPRQALHLPLEFLWKPQVVVVQECHV